MMGNTDILNAVGIAEDAAHEELKAIFTEVLDAHYDARPSSNAFGTGDATPTGQPNGTWFMGRDGDEGVDYVCRRWDERDNRGRPEEQTLYVYGKYGWADLNEIVEVAPFLRQVLEQATERYEIESDILNRFDAIMNTVETGLYNSRERVDLPTLATLFRERELDALRPILGAGDEDRLNLWTLLHSKDDKGEVIDNPVEIPLCDDDEGLMLVRAKRYFYDQHREPDGKWYTVAHVVGYDDTPEQFFMHRLESDKNLRDDDFEWTVGKLREKMGFDLEYDEWLAGGNPTGERVRIQGDLAFVRHDYKTEMWEYYDQQLATKKNRLVKEHSDELLEQFSPTVEDVMSVHYKTFNSTPRVTTSDTQKLKDIQAELGIEEETVREEQDRRGISRLSGKRRGEIVEDILFDRVYDEALAIAETTAEAVEAEVESETKAQFTETRGQENLVLGNHTVIVGPSREHPNRSRANEADALSVLCVPGEANGVVWHDEHENKKLELPTGVYEFRFLDGHETQWWMTN